MSRQSRFQYALQPVLLRRQWDLDELKLDLNLINESLNRLTQERTDLQRESERVGNEWSNQSKSASNIVVERLTTVVYYLEDLARQIKERSAKIDELKVERETMIDRIALAQRGLEAIEQHRDEMSESYLKHILNKEFKLADDHWTTLHTGNEKI
jgi:hypothetical protein